MKLPTDPKERTQMLVLVGLAALGILYAGVRYGVSPLIKKSKDKKNAIVELQEKIRIGSQVSKSIPEYHKRMVETITKIIKLTDKNALKPIVTNYLLPAKSHAEQQARKVPVFLRVTSGGSAGLPTLTRRKSNAFSMFQARVFVDCDLRELAKLLYEIENSNAYISIANIRIVGNKAKEFVHRVQFDVQWPRWASEDGALLAELNDKLIESSNQLQKHPAKESSDK